MKSSHRRTQRKRSRGRDSTPSQERRKRSPNEFASIPTSGAASLLRPAFALSRGEQSDAVIPAKRPAAGRREREPGSIIPDVDHNDRPVVMGPGSASLRSAARDDKRGEPRQRFGQSTP